MKNKPTSYAQRLLLSKQLCQARKEVAVSLAFRTVKKDGAPIANTERACEQIEKYSAQNEADQLDDL